jgi:hypothetical protein
MDGSFAQRVGANLKHQRVRRIRPQRFKVSLFMDTVGVVSLYDDSGLEHLFS